MVNMGIVQRGIRMFNPVQSVIPSSVYGVPCLDCTGFARGSGRKVVVQRSRCMCHLAAWRPAFPPACGSKGFPRPQARGAGGGMGAAEPPVSLIASEHEEKE